MNNRNTITIIVFAIVILAGIQYNNSFKYISDDKAYSKCHTLIYRQITI